MLRKILGVAVVSVVSTALAAGMLSGRRAAAHDDPPEKTARLPEGLRQVPPDALFFVHFRVADFLAGDQGQTLLKQIEKSKELAKVKAEAEKALGMSLSDVESATVIVLGPPPGWDPRFGMGRTDGKIFLTPDDNKHIWKELLPYIEKDFKDFKLDDKRPSHNEKPKGEEKSKSKESPQARSADGGDFVFQRDLQPQGGPPDWLRHAESAESAAWDPERSQGVIITGRKTLDRKKLLAAFVGEPREHGFSKPGILFLSDRSVLIGAPQFLIQYADAVKREKTPAPLQPALELATQKHMVAGGGHVPDALRRAVQLKMQAGDSPLLAMIYPLVNLRSAAFTLDLGDKASLNVRLFGRNERSTELAAEAVKTALAWTDLNFEKLSGGAGASKFSKNAQALVKKLRDGIASAKVTQQGTTASVQLALDIDAATLHAALAEAVVKVHFAARRVQSQNNLKQIALAMLNYEATYRGFPPPALSSVKNKDGKPLLSWRVAILPYIEQENLYRQFNLDEPWDSPTNKKLIAQMPAIYAAPGVKTKTPGTTYYQVFVGPGTAFEPMQGRGLANIRIADISDGTSNTLMVVEAGDPVIWTKPDDLPYDPKRPLPKLGGIFEDGFNAALCDGSVRFLRRTISADTLRALITRNAGDIPGADFND